MFSKSTLLISSLVLAAGLGACTSAEKRNAEQQAHAEEAARAQREAQIKAQKDAEVKLFTQLKPNELRTLVQDAVVFGYPLMAMDATKALSTQSADLNQFHHVRVLPDASFMAVVSPNTDTLSSSAWLDLSKEPLVLSVPSTGNTYYMMQILDAWSNVIASPGTRTTGNSAGDFAIVGPNWEGQLPVGVQKIQAPTNMVWIIAHTRVRETKNYEMVHAIQNRYRVMPLSQFDRSMAAQVNPVVPEDIGIPKFPWRATANEMVTAMGAKSFFTRLSYLMKVNPPAAQDRMALDKLAKIGVTPGQIVNFDDLPADVRRNLDEAVGSGYERVQELAKYRPGRLMNGWVYQSDMGTYGTNYDARAGGAWFGLGANPKEDVIQPTAKVDAEGSVLDGQNKYVIRFAKGQMPPVNGFWSITMYDPQQHFVANSLKRYSLGSKDRLKKNKDGSVSIYIQPTNPGKARVANWLPAPRGNFSLMARLYWPKQSALNEEWQMPGVQKIRPTMRLTQKTAKRISQR